MRKIYITLFVSLLNFIIILGVNACSTQNAISQQFAGEATRIANIRTAPCTGGSTVLRQSQKYAVYNIVGKIDGWYKIEYSRGNYGWIWDEAIKQSPVISIKKYFLSEEDYKLSKKVAYKISKIVNSKGIKYKDIYISQLEKYLKKRKPGARSYELVRQIIIDTKQIKLTNHALNQYKEYNIDIDNIKSYRKDLHNTARKQRSKSNYSYDSRLDNTAYQWSMNSREKGIMDHKRFNNSGYYDYPVIESWFQERGVTCTPSGGVTSSESIAKFGFYCTDGNCNDELKESMKRIFDIYMAEEGMTYPANAHYRAIVHSSFNYMGMGIALEKTNERNYYQYYLTTHFCTTFK